MSKDEEIKQRQRLSSYGSYRPEKCMICGTTFQDQRPCNSHSIPQFVLKSLNNGASGNDKSGQFYPLNSFLQIPWVNKVNGRNNTGTFSLLCKKCDGSCFQNYERADIYTKSLLGNANLQTILNEIAMKNYLYSYYDAKKTIARIEKELRQEETSSFTSRKELNRRIQILNQQLDAETANAKDSFQGFKNTCSIRAKLQSKPSTILYTVDFYHQYNRLFPLAFQGKITIEYDCWGNHINNLFAFDQATQDMHLCIFPIRGTTMVLSFSRRKDKKIQLIRKNLNKKKVDETAKALTAMAMTASGNFAVYINTPESIFNNQYLRSLAGETGTILTHTYTQNNNVSPSQAQKLAHQSVRENHITGARKHLTDYLKIPNKLIGLNNV
ncbi:hypothetical protein KIH77_06445 [Bifidobacterium sp. 82T24]|uniref:hypothetical protein n=1 Tax=Bifidobacterium pluvialisilvae TaxID=2834436 RepID=UPI001C56CABB|nr:hypothetical protein [Bifidobacterium pluvialisilvae]MBW3088368.1 hypothetical protein [Bifidobacterium pluvialisilvae]